MSRYTYLYHKPHSQCKLLIKLCILIICCGLSDGQAEKVITVVENTPAPVTIGSLARDPSSPSVHYSVLNPALDSVISEIPGSPQFKDIFDIQSNGEVIVKRQLDREQKAVYDLLVAAGNTDVYTVQIRVLDLNDNAPTFNPSVRNISVAENTQANEELASLGSATDSDEGNNSTQRYELINNFNNLFQLETVQVCEYLRLSKLVNLPR